jgi:hypothetical protein
VNRHLSQRRLVALLREATGIDEVEPDRRPWTGATVRLDTAIRTKSTQRISLQQQDDSLALSTFPAELKLPAEALYRTGRAQRLMDSRRKDHLRDCPAPHVPPGHDGGGSARGRERRAARRLLGRAPG